jgi:hypothetical protein
MTLAERFRLLAYRVGATGSRLVFSLCGALHGIGRPHAFDSMSGNRPHFPRDDVPPDDVRSSSSCPVFVARRLSAILVSG